MSDALVDRAVLERLAKEVLGRCRFCGCTGGSCKTQDAGETCVLIGRAGLETRCNGYRCELAYLAEQKEARRKWKRSAA